MLNVSLIFMLKGWHVFIISGAMETNLNPAAEEKKKI